MEISEKIEQKFEKLLANGREILQRCGYSESEGLSRHPSRVDYLRFRTESTNLIVRVCGKQSPHYLEMANVSKSKQMSNNSYFFPLCLGILEAAYADYSEGFLFDLRSLISAEILGDFIDQAEELLSKNYYVAAASLSGAVLEDSLRRICEINQIEVPEKTSIEIFNVALVKAEIYNKLKQKQITAWADLRNKADHGKFKEVKKDDVGNMIEWVKKFQYEFLGN